MAFAGGTRADPAAEAPAPPTVAAGYGEILAALAGARETLSADWKRARSPQARRAVLDEARRVAHDAIVEDLFPTWLGTPWAFEGTSQTPGEGTIACGYFVSTVLRDAGFKVERIRLAQQASERIVRTLAGADVRRHSGRSPEQMIELLRAGADGLFVVGFDYHVGFVVKEGEDVRFCHSSWIESGGVACEDPATTAAWASQVYVVGQILGDPMLVAWLEQTPIPTLRSPGKR